MTTPPRVAGTSARRIPLPGLWMPETLAFPFSEKVTVPEARWAQTEGAIREALLSNGYEIRVSDLVTLPSAAGSAKMGGILAERNVYRVQGTTMVRLSIAVMMVGGITLGVVDAAIASNWEYALPWIAVFSGLAVIWWSRFGGTYVSDIAVVLVPAAPAAVGAPPTRTVTWLAGRVRSEVAAGSSPLARSVVRIEHDFGALGPLSAAVREFRQRVSAAG